MWLRGSFSNLLCIIIFTMDPVLRGGFAFTRNEFRECFDSVPLFCIAGFLGAYGADSPEAASVW